MITQNRLLQLKDGDADAFAELYELGQSKLFAYFYHRTFNAQLSEDLAQDTWTKVLEQLDKYVPREGIPIMAWIFRIAHNMMVDHLRSKQNKVIVLSTDFLHGGLDQWEPEDTKILTEERQAHKEDLKKALSYLTEEQRAVIQCRFLNGLSILETSLVVQRSEDAVKKLQQRALMNLRRELGRNYNG